jgi:hypothetical protein
MARKRGGLAGLYDRNKGVIKALAPMALGAIPGVGMPLAVLAGAALGGDTEGKGYFSGFNTGGALKGAAAGYGQGATGAGVKGLLTGGKAGASQALSEYNRPISKFFGGGAGSAQAPAQTPGMPTPEPKPSMFKQASEFAKSNKDLLTLAGQGIQSALPDAASDAAVMNAETNRMRLEEESRQAKMEEERRRRIAQLLMPYATQNFPQYFGGR